MKNTGGNILTKRLSGLLLIFVALILSAVVITSVSGQTHFLSDLGKPLQIGAAVGYALGFLVIAFFVAIFVMEMILFFIHSRTSTKGILELGERKNSSMLNTILSLAFLFSLVGLYFLLNSRHRLAGSLNTTTPPAITNSTAPLQGLTGGSSLFSAAGGFILSIIIPLILIMGAVSAFLAIRSYRIHDEKPDQAALTAALSESIGRDIVEIRESVDPRVAILETYRNMCKFLSERGAEDKKWWTAREFENGVTSRFNLERTTVSELTSLFEEARYSEHEMGEQERISAMALLENIREQLNEDRQGGGTAH
jgi:large-conductance mechanosensitive channel